MRTSRFYAIWRLLNTLAKPLQPEYGTSQSTGHLRLEIVKQRRYFLRVRQLNASSLPAKHSYGFGAQQQYVRPITLSPLPLPNPSVEQTIVDTWYKHGGDTASSILFKNIVPANSADSEESLLGNFVFSNNIDGVLKYLNFNNSSLAIPERRKGGTS